MACAEFASRAFGSFKHPVCVYNMWELVDWNFVWLIKLKILFLCVLLFFLVQYCKNNTCIASYRLPDILILASTWARTQQLKTCHKAKMFAKNTQILILNLNIL